VRMQSNRHRAKLRHEAKDLEVMGLHPRSLARGGEIPEEG
jgi:hypothetical protein